MQATLSTTAVGDLSRPRFDSDLPPSTFSNCTAVASSWRLASAVPGSPTATELTPIPQGEYSLAEGRGLAHDAGNLLGALRLYCGLLAQPGVLRAEHRHYADELLLLSSRSGSLIHRLLEPKDEFVGRGRTMAEASKANHDDVSLPEMIEGCEGLLDTIAGGAVRVLCEDRARAYRAAIPRESVERILVNLTKNAAEASPGGGGVTLRVRIAAHDEWKGEMHLVLSVEDEGCGMSPAAAAVLTGQDRSPATGRRGLGLRVVRELVAGSGGELRLRSTAGHGTVIEIAWRATLATPSLQPVQEGSSGLDRRKQVASVRVSRGVWNGTMGGTTACVAGTMAGRVSC